MDIKSNQSEKRRGLRAEAMGGQTTMIGCAATGLGDQLPVVRGQVLPDVKAQQNQTRDNSSVRHTPLHGRNLQ